MKLLRNVVVGRVSDDAGLAAALYSEPAARGIDSWPIGPEIAAEYASSELIERLERCQGLVLLATPALLGWPFALKQARLARQLSSGVLVVSIGAGTDGLAGWLAQIEPDEVRTSVDAVEAASTVEQWSPPPLDQSPPAVRFAAARAALLGVASHGGRISEVGPRGIDPRLLQSAALHLRSIGLIDFAGPLDVDQTTLITVS